MTGGMYDCDYCAGCSEEYPCPQRVAELNAMLKAMEPLVAVAVKYRRYLHGTITKAKEPLRDAVDKYLADIAKIR